MTAQVTEKIAPEASRATRMAVKFPLFLLMGCLLWLSGLKLVAADAPYIVNTIGDQSLNRGGASMTLDVSHLYALNNVTGPLVEFNFSGGKMYLELFPDVAPLTVANFLRYTDNKIYDNTFIHRFVSGFVMQAGGYQWVSGTPHVPVYAPVVSEFNLSNLAGTMAMAKLPGTTQDPNTNLNSATSEWFVNLVDNTALDGVDNQSIPLKFTVFGRLIGNGLGFCQSIANLQNVNLGSPFDNLPVINYTSGSVLLSNLLVLQTVKRVPLVKLDDAVSGYLTLTTSSSNPGAVAAAITSSGLTLTSVAAGDATITLQATDYYGNAVGMSFTAHSVIPVYAISATAKPASYGTVRGARAYLEGAKVTLRAVPKSKYKFKKWTENGKTVSSKASYSFVASRTRALVAVFSK